MTKYESRHWSNHQPKREPHFRAVLVAFVLAVGLVCAVAWQMAETAETLRAQAGKEAR